MIKSRHFVQCLCWPTDIVLHNSTNTNLFMFTKDEMNLKIVLFFLQYMQWQGVIYVCVNKSADYVMLHTLSRVLQNY